MIVLCEGTRAIDAFPKLLDPRNPDQYLVDVDEATYFRLMGGENPRPYRSVAEARRQAKLLVNQKAGQSRQKYLTDIPGQDISYQQKVIELEKYEAAVAAGQTITPTDYPWLNAEAIGSHATIAQVAALVRSTADAWTVLGSQIEGIRRGAIVDIDLAQTLADIDAIPLAVVFP